VAALYHAAINQSTKLITSRRNLTLAQVDRFLPYPCSHHSVIFVTVVGLLLWQM